MAGPCPSRPHGRRTRPIRSTLLAAITAAILAGPASAVPLQPPHATGRQHVLIEHVAACTQRTPRPCIAHAARVYDQPYRLLVAIAWCESRLDPYARNPSGASGLFQFLPSTWRSTPYRWRSIWSARWQAMAAGWMFAHGRAREWSCLHLS